MRMGNKRFQRNGKPKKNWSRRDSKGTVQELLLREQEGRAQEPRLRELPFGWRPRFATPKLWLVIFCGKIEQFRSLLDCGKIVWLLFGWLKKI